MAVTTLLSRHPLIASLYSFCFKITKNRKILLRQPKTIKRRKKGMTGTNMLELNKESCVLPMQAYAWKWNIHKVIYTK
jgi:hypothetical protein